MILSFFFNVSFICSHGPIALAQCVKPNGEPLVKGMSVTGFTDTEEAAVGYTNDVPFLIESKFKELGANYTRSEGDWGSHVVADGKLGNITRLVSHNQQLSLVQKLSLSFSYKTKQLSLPLFFFLFSIYIQLLVKIRQAAKHVQKRLCLCLPEIFFGGIPWNMHKTRMPSIHEAKLVTGTKSTPNIE